MIKPENSLPREGPAHHDELSTEICTKLFDVLNDYDGKIRKKSNGVAEHVNIIQMVMVKFIINYCKITADTIAQYSDKSWSAKDFLEALNLSCKDTWKATEKRKKEAH